MAWDDTKVSEDVNNSAWELAGMSGLNLAERALNGTDPVIKEFGEYVHRLGATRTLYSVVPIASGNGWKLSAVWREEPDDYPYGWEEIEA